MKAGCANKWSLSVAAIAVNKIRKTLPAIALGWNAAEANFFASPSPCIDVPKQIYIGLRSKQL